MKLFETKKENEFRDLIRFYDKLLRTMGEEAVKLTSCFIEGRLCAILTEREDDFVDLGELVKNREAFTQERCRNTYRELKDFLSTLAVRYCLDEQFKYKIYLFKCD